MDHQQYTGKYNTIMYKVKLRQHTVEDPLESNQCYKLLPQTPGPHPHHARMKRVTNIKYGEHTY